MAVCIGVVGGGQLAAMLVDVCRQQGTRCLILDQDSQCPAVLAGGEWIEGDSWDLASLKRLAEAVDVITVEIEHVDVDNLELVASAGIRVIPPVPVLASIVDKYKQKQLLIGSDIPTSPCQFVPADETVSEAPYGFPLVWKACRGGYDGRGVNILEQESELPFSPEVDGFIEAHVDNSMELAVMVAVNATGETSTWSPVEMVFDPGSNMLDFLVAPARVSEPINIAAQELAIRTITSINGIGIFGVEMFLDHSGNLLVNEISPRTHNSGHFTMDAASTSQFEQQHRILTDQPLAATEQQTPAVMVNILGHTGYRGETVVENLEEIEATPDTYVHLYGKLTCFPKRKMGHATLTDGSIDSALNRAAEVRNQLIVRGADVNE